MAPAEAPGPLGKYIDEEIPDILAKYDKLWEVEDPEETPYKTKYEARELLKGALDKVEALLAEAPEDDDADRGREMAARLRFFMGKNLYWCEEVPEAERLFVRALEAYLRSPLRLEPKYFVYIQDVLNQLGMLWCNRQGHAEGMNFLRRAQIMFLNRPEAVRQTCDKQADNNYTLTMFYLAQAYGALQKGHLSARFCAETMSRQLEHNAPGQRPKELQEKDPFDCKDWVRNCCSLSDFFINECMFWTAEYLLHAGEIMCERCVEVCGFKPENIEELKAECARDLGTLFSTRLKFALTCRDHPELCEKVWRGERKAAPSEGDREQREGSRLTFRCAADAGAPLRNSEEIAIVWDDVFPELVYLEDEEAQDNKMAEEEAATGADMDAKILELSPGELVRLPVHFRTLHARIQRRMQRANTAFIALRGDPAAAFELALKTAQARNPNAENAENANVSTSPDEETTPPSEMPRRLPTCAGTNFETVREIFKLGTHYFQRSLAYFLLDGWVTEHVRILQELSQMYRTLQAWEEDPRRLAAMMTRRCRMLTPLVDLLNPRAYVAFYRQLTYEAAEVYQELYSLKLHGNICVDGGEDEEEDTSAPMDPAAVRKAARCNELARKSIHYYGTFIDSYSPDGKVPETFETDHVRPYLMARLNRARLNTKMKGLNKDEQVEAHKSALLEYEWIRSYDERHPEVRTKQEIGMATEMKLCEEMVRMLPSKLSRLAASRWR